MPFYAGWGLTHDEHTLTRRTRQLRLEDLIYQALIAYPTYIHPVRQEPMTVEEAVTLLSNMPRGEMRAENKKLSRLSRQIRKAKMFYQVKFG